MAPPPRQRGVPTSEAVRDKDFAGTDRTLMAFPRKNPGLTPSAVGGVRGHLSMHPIDGVATHAVNAAVALGGAAVYFAQWAAGVIDGEYVAAGGLAATFAGAMSATGVVLERYYRHKKEMRELDLQERRLAEQEAERKDRAMVEYRRALRSYATAAFRKHPSLGLPPEPPDDDFGTGDFPKAPP